jgi:nitrogenase-stabilizing/protective protein
MDGIFETLETAEDFLRYFQVPFDVALVRHRHIALLRFFHQILHRYPGPRTYDQYRQALSIAYRQIATGRQLPFDVHDCRRCGQYDRQ